MPSRPKRNNAQHQPLTTVLRNIIREYPAGGGVLRELTQNADDSGATQLEFVLDETAHTATPLLHEELAEYQGPSLLAFNNSTFSERDFLSLSRIGDSAKAHDLSSTGKFGRGFNSVYNWTDGPTILSGSSLLLLDPHESWSREVNQPGGPLYDFVECSDEPDMINQLSPFKPIVGDFTQAFKGTVIRIPLRTAPQASRSKILDLDRKPTEIAEIKEVFKTFAKEMVESLLFLRHISSITLKIGHSVYAKAVARKYAGNKDITGSFSLDEAFQSVLVEGKETMREVNFVVEITFELLGEKEHRQRFAITHHFRDHADNPELNEWARKYKLMPWAAIASPLPKDDEFVGRLFNILPLPIYSQQPAHLQALFSVRPDRASIHSGDDSAASEQSETKRGAKWNTWLFEECIVDAWITNLQFMSSIPGDVFYAGWDSWPHGFQENEGRHLGTGTLGRVFERIIREKRKLLPTISDTLATGAEVIFASRLEDTLKAALLDAGIIVVCPPSDRSFELTNSNALLQEHGIQLLTPRSVRAALDKLSGTMENLSADSRSCLLDYILSDHLYNELAMCSAPLLPMMDGGYRSFQKSNIRYRFNRENEAVLFSLCAAYSIDNTKLSTEASPQFSVTMDSLQSTNIRNWDLDGAIWYVERYLFSSGLASHSSDTISRSDFTKWIEMFWSWVFLKAPNNAISATSHLWLVPLIGDRYRKVGSSEPPNLDISGPGPIAEIFRTITQTTAGADKYPIYSGYGISPYITNQFRHKQVVVDCENLHCLLNWLSYFPRFLDSISFSLRTRMVEQIGNLAPAAVRSTAAFNFVPALRLMPFFRLAFHETGEEREWIRLSEKGVRYVAVSTKDGLPPLHRSNTVFIDKEDPGVSHILRIFDLAELPSQRTLLEEYVIPNIQDTTVRDARTTLVHYVMKPENTQTIGKVARDSLAKIDFVPVHGNDSLLICPSKVVDPLSPASGLYFEDENLFPDNAFLVEFRESLTKLGMISVASQKIILERLTKFSKVKIENPDLPARLQHFFTVASSPPQLSAEYLALKWIPAIDPKGERSLCNSHECRDMAQRGQVGYAMHLTELDIGPRWQKELGWDSPPAAHYILRQLKEAVERRDRSVVTSLLQLGWLERNGVQQELDEIAWLPGLSGEYYRRSEVFLREAEFHPYLDVLDPQVWKYFPTNQGAGPFAVEDCPSFEKLKEVQDLLGRGGKIEGQELKVFVALLEAVAERFPKHKHLSMMKIPDTEGNLHNFGEMTNGDPSAEYPEDYVIHFLHPTITPHAIKLLRFPTIQDRFLERIAGTEFIQDFEQEEKLVTVIADTLKRYSITSSFTEFLANAEDCGSATKVCWVVDGTPKYPSKFLITNELKECQGQALFCYNDGVFSEEDFSAVIKIGVGSKRETPSKIGRFGRGSMTMYHWSLTPSFISGEYFVIFDPEQKRLPENPATRKRRKGMKMRLRDVRMTWPDQLKPFEGLFGFTSDSENFNGTLFRFPVMESRNSELYSQHRMATYEAIMRQFTGYHTTGFAQVSLTFLKKITSIEGWQRNMQTGEFTQAWCVTSSIVTENITSPSNFTMEHIDIMSTPKGKKERWVIMRGEVPENLIPNALRTTQKEERLQARCAIAAPVSLARRIHGFGNLFLTLPTDYKLGLPVCISADMVVGSDRKSIPLFEERGNAAWNRWILEYAVSTLYVKFLAGLTRTPGVNIYQYWPEHPSQNKSGGLINTTISKAVWKLVLNDFSSYPLFPVHAVNRETSTLTHVGPQQACFNIIPEPYLAGLIDDILPRLPLGLRKFVSPKGSVLSSLQTLSPDLPATAQIITPEYILDLFRTRNNCEILLERWKVQGNFRSQFMNTFLTFVAQAGHEALSGCTILPLANGFLGTLGPAGNENYLVPSTDQAIERELLDLIPSLCVHPDLTASFVRNPKHLNISPFSFGDLPRIVKALGTKEQPERLKGLSIVWSYFDMMGSTTQMQIENLLEDLPVIAASRPTHPSQYHFITLRDFISFKTPVILEGCADFMNARDRRDVKSILRLFKGGLLIDVNVFPKTYLPRESLRERHGLRRLLACINSLANRRGCRVEMFVRESLAGNSRYLEILGKAVGHVDWASLDQDSEKTGVSAIKILRQLPILPSGSSLLKSWISAETAHLAPGKGLNLLSITCAEEFVDSSWANTHARDLKILGVNPMPVLTLLSSHTRFQLGRHISGGDLLRHVNILEWLSSKFPSVLQDSAVALDGNGRVRMANTLYDHQNPIFQAAFHHRQESKFLHPLLRKIQWISVIKTTSSANTLIDCITAIENQADYGLDVAQVLQNAAKVSELVKWDTPELRTLCSDQALSARVLRAEFVPALCVLDNGTFRNSVMRSLVPPSRLIALSAGALIEDAPLCWSQVPFFAEKPCDTVLAVIPGRNRGRPSAKIVVSHLIMLSRTRTDISRTEIPDYINSAKECYRYLQALREPFSIPPEEQIWFNTEEKNPNPETFVKSWVCTKNLCLGLEYGSETLQQVHSSLRPFIELLETCKVPTLRGPRTPPEQPAGISYFSQMFTQFQLFRQQRKLFDAVVKVGNKEFEAHRFILCASSELFAQMFSVGMKEAETGIVELKDITEDTVKWVLDFIYTGDMTPIQESQDPTDEIEKLLELLEATNRFFLPGLKGKVERVLCSSRYIRPETVRHILVGATDYRADMLAGECEAYIQHNKAIMVNVGE